MTADREARILTAEQIAELRSYYMGMTREETEALFDSHEALRSRLGEEIRRADEAIGTAARAMDRSERLEARVRELGSLLAGIREYFVGFDLERTDGRTSPVIAEIDAALSGVAPAQETKG